jgi:hypothetical protein
LSSADRAAPVAEQSFCHATPDGSVWVRVSVRGHIVGVQIEPAAMRRGGHRIAEQLMACADAAYLEGQVSQRRALAALWGTDAVVEGMPTDQDLAAALARLKEM